MATAKPPVDDTAFANEMGELPAASDRLRLVALDHAVRVQQGRMGAAKRRLALVRAQRADDTQEIARLSAAIDGETRLQRGYRQAIATAEVEVPSRSADTFVIHGRVYDETGAPADDLTVAAVRVDGSVRRYTCTDGTGYFRMDLPLDTGSEETPSESVFLQVSDAEQAVLYRGDEALMLAEQDVVYRVIRLSGDRHPPCPLPPDRATMLNLLDRPESVAVAILGRLGLELGSRLTQRAPDRAGLVVSQTPPAGTPITNHTKVTLVIGTAEEGDTVAVPDVVGLSRDEAQTKLSEAGLAMGQVSEEPGAPTGTVLKQDPAPGIRVRPGTSVALVVAVAPQEDLVDVPDLTGLRLEEADKILREIGLERSKVSLRDDARAGVIVDHDPAAGSPVARGARVDLVVGRSSDVEQTEVPSVVGETLSGARRILEGARLQLGEVTGPQNGRVQEQKPVSGPTVPVGSAVSVVLARGGGGQPSDFVDVLTRAAAGRPEFQNLGIQPEALREQLVAAEVDNLEAAKRVLDLPDQDLQQRFSLKNRRQARQFRRILESAIEDL
jgi:beta-lactam-binding protein with PASTA domain